LAHCKQRIKSILLCHGLTLKVGLSKAWSKAGIEELKQMALNEELRWSMDEMLAELQEVRLAVVRCNRKLREMAKLPRYREMVARLMTVPGVGNIVAMGMVLEVLDMERFASGRCLAKYLGLAPLTRESGKKKIEEGRCSAGMQKVRTLLIESAWRWRQQDAYAREQYNKYYKNCGGIAQKAITALARKLALILWRLALGNRELGKLPYLPGLKRVPPSAIARNPQ
jgi:transposase